MQKYLLIQKKNVLTGFFGKRLNLLKIFTKATSKTSRATILELGLSIARIDLLKSKKFSSYYKWRIDPPFFFQKKFLRIGR